MKKGIILLSGGLDSATLLAHMKHEGFAPYALTISYGQRHGIELEASKSVAQALGVIEHRFLPMDLRVFGGSSLTSSLEVTKSDELPGTTEVPSTYVPARNTIFLSLALAYAEVVGAYDIFYGSNAVDYSNYPDCRPEFVTAFENLANKATKAVDGDRSFKIHAPLLYLSKAEIIQKGMALGVDYSITHSCYDPIGEKACGHCESCLLRKQGFAKAGVVDPTNYGHPAT